jgi:dGTPase
MDWSDDVSYSVHDIEDAIHGGHMDVRILESAAGRSEVIELARSWYGENFTVAGLDEALTRLRELPEWPTNYDGTLPSLAAMKNLTSALIGRFCLAATQATRATHGPGPHTRYSAHVIVPEQSRFEVTALKALAARFVMSRAGAEQVYQRQRDLIAELVAAIGAAPERTLDSVHIGLWRHANRDSERHRIIIDQVAALTDVSVGQWHERLCS